MSVLAAHATPTRASRRMGPCYLQETHRVASHGGGAPRVRYRLTADENGAAFQLDHGSDHYVGVELCKAIPATLDHLLHERKESALVHVDIESDFREPWLPIATKATFAGLGAWLPVRAEEQRFGTPWTSHPELEDIEQDISEVVDQMQRSSRIHDYCIWGTFGFLGLGGIVLGMMDYITANALDIAIGAALAATDAVRGYTAPNKRDLTPLIEDLKAQRDLSGLTMVAADALPNVCIRFALNRQPLFDLEATLGLTTERAPNNVQLARWVYCNEQHPAYSPALKSVFPASAVASVTDDRFAEVE